MGFKKQKCYIAEKLKKKKVAKNKLIAPFLKWVGGKRQIMPSIVQLLPKNITSYCEPFAGGGAVLFHLQPQKANRSINSNGGKKRIR